MLNSPLVLPIVTIDPTFSTLIKDVYNALIPSDKFWISCYRTSYPSVHGKIHAELDEINRNLVKFKSTEGDVEINRRDNGNYDVSCNPLNIQKTHILSPVQEYLDAERSNYQRPQRITAFDVAPDTTKFATGFLDGSVFIYPTSSLPAQSEFQIPESITTKDIKTTSRPHLSTVTRLKFFPSSRVLLSAGADFSLAILPAELPTIPTRIAPALTLRSHTRSITAISTIALGRNILSASMDSTIKLWDVPSGTAINTLASHSPILSASLGERTPTPPDGEEPVLPTERDTREIPEAQSKIVFCGLQNGAFELFDLGLKSSVYRSATASDSSGLTSINYSHDHHLLATGSSRGVVTLYDTRTLGAPLTSFSRNAAGIEDVTFVVGRLGGEVSLAIATDDGLPYVAGVIPEGPAVRMELVGGDCDPVRIIRARDGDGERKEVWSAADDAIVRRYLI